MCFVWFQRFSFSNSRRKPSFPQITEGHRHPELARHIWTGHVISNNICKLHILPSHPQEKKSGKNIPCYHRCASEKVLPVRNTQLILGMCVSVSMEVKLQFWDAQFKILLSHQCWKFQRFTKIKQNPLSLSNNFMVLQVILDNLYLLTDLSKSWNGRINTKHMCLRRLLWWFPTSNPSQVKEPEMQQENPRCTEWTAHL